MGFATLDAKIITLNINFWKLQINGNDYKMLKMLKSLQTVFQTKL